MEAEDGLSSQQVDNLGERALQVPVRDIHSPLSSVQLEAATPQTSENPNSAVRVNDSMLNLTDPPTDIDRGRRAGPIETNSKSDSNLHKYDAHDESTNVRIQNNNCNSSASNTSANTGASQRYDITSPRY
jgi:hypothetical protein